MTAVKRLSATVATMLVVFALMMVTAGAALADDLAAKQLFSYQNLERGVTVGSNGTIYAIDTSGYINKFNSTGGSAGSKIKLPSTYCGNLCSASDGTVFAHTYSDGKILIISPGSSTYKTVYAGVECQFLATDSNGYLYNVNSADKNSATIIYRAKVADVVALSANGTITWEAFLPNYTPPAGTKYYPAAIDVDGAGNVYIVDQGSSAGSDASVSGIYKYNLNTGKITELYFNAENTVTMKWVHSVTADDFGNVAVLGRNSNAIAVFKSGSTVANAFISVPGFADDVDSDADGNIVYSVGYNGTAENNGVYRILMNNVAVSSVSLSASSKSLYVGGSFTLGATISPSNATNKNVTFTSSNAAVAKVSEAGKVTAVKAGKATITVKTDQGGQTAQCTVTVNKKANTLTVTAKTATLKVKKLKQKAQTIKRAKAMAMSKAQGAVTYKLDSVTKAKFKKYFKVNAKNGTITVKKGLKKGTYKVKVKVTAAGNATYKPLTKPVTVTVKVK